MQWLLALETNDDPISTCRLMNIFRRKNVKIVTLAVAARPAGLSILALVETPEADVEHIFNFLRRTEGVQHVTYYRHEPAGDASFIFVDSDADSSSLARFLETFPESKLVVAAHGKYLLEIPAEKRPGATAKSLGEPGFLPLAYVRSTRTVSDPELVGTPAR